MDKFVTRNNNQSDASIKTKSTSSKSDEGRLTIIGSNGNGSNCLEDPRLVKHLLEDDIENNNQIQELNSDSSDSVPAKKEKELTQESEKRHMKKPSHKIYKQKFSLQWLSEFKWAAERNGLTVCTVCNDMKIVGGGFHLRRYANSSSHISNVKKILNTQKIRESLENSTLMDKINDAEIKITCFICEHHLSFRLADSLPLVCKNTFQDSEIAKKIKIGRTKCTNIAVTKLSPYVKKDLVEHLRENKFSLILDETIDISTQKSLVVVVKLWGNTGVQDRFLDLIKVKDSTAECLFQSVKNLLNTNKIPYNNVVGFGADNASVMMGDITGVQAKLKQICPNLVVLGCACHSAHLCVSAACLKLPNTIEQFARDIYNYFSHSSKRQEELREFQIFAQEVIHKMLRPSQTRWLPLIMVVHRLLDHWSSLTLYFQSAVLVDNLPVAKPILESLLSSTYKLYFNLLSHALTWIVKLNLELQREKPQIATFLKSVSNLYKAIPKCYIKINVLNSTKLSAIKEDYPRNFKPLEEIYFGAKIDALIKSGIRIDRAELHSFQLQALDFYIELCKQLKARFDIKNPHLRYASNFTIENALSVSIVSISEYLNLYPSINVDPELVNFEWQALSEQFTLEDYSNSETIDFWYAVEKKKNRAGEPMFSNLITVVKYVMVFPHSSAAAERAFSQLTLIKIKLRNKLKILTCAAVLHIKDGIKHNVLNYKTITAKKISVNLKETEETENSVEKMECEELNNIFELFS